MSWIKNCMFDMTGPPHRVWSQLKVRSEAPLGDPKNALVMEVFPGDGQP